MAKPAKPKAKPPAKPAAAQPPLPSPEDMAERRAVLRVAQLRERLTKAMDDPAMRDQMVKAIRAMIADGQ